MRRLTSTLVTCGAMALLLSVGCSDSDTTSSSSQPAGGPVWGGSGENNWEHDPEGGSGNGLPGGGFAGAEDEDDAVRCNVDDNCPAEIPYCSSSGYCFECLEAEQCPAGEGCFDGACLPESCTAGETLCSLDNLHTCTPNGAGWNALECPGVGGTCIDGACTGCTPGFAECVGKDQRLVCNADGSALVEESCPEGGFCADGACLECYPGTTRCDGQWVQSCNTSGTWENSENCSASMGQCAAGVCQNACGQTGKLSNEGCDYWAIDMDNAGPAADSPYAVIVSNLNASEVAITVTSRSSASTEAWVVAQGTVPAGGVEVFQLPQQNLGSTGVFWKALRVQSTGPIVAYQFNPLENVAVYSNDASLLLPSNTYGQEYVVVSREEIPGGGLESYRGSIAVVASTENTEVTITPSAPTLGGGGLPFLEKGETATVILQPYQVLNIQSDMLGADLTGTFITADQPIGVFGGHEAAVSGEQCCADHLEQQLFPVDTWGKTYVGGKSRARGIEKDYWRIVAASDGTSVEISPSIPGVQSPILLNRGEFHEFQTERDFVLESNEPVMVAQTLASSQEIVGPMTCLDSSECAQGYSCSWVSPECMADVPYCSVNSDCPDSHTCSCGDLGFCTCEPVGDPALILAVPVEQYRSKYVFLTPTNFKDDYVNIIAPNGASVDMDGQMVPPGLFSPIQGTEYRVARLMVSDGAHRIDASQPVGVIVYGYDDDVSYGYPAGLDLTAQ